MDWHDLEKLTVVKLREEAHEKGVEGVHGKDKPELLDALAGILGIEKPHEELSDKGVHDKAGLKLQIRALKVERARFLEAHDHKSLKEVRRKIRGLKRQIRRIHAAAPVVG